MRIFLQLVSASSDGPKKSVESGQILRIGRSAPSEWIFPDDMLMSSVHFSISCGQENCHVRDLKSRNGTSVNGKTINSTVIRQGDIISAGNARFSLVVEDVRVKHSPVAKESPALEQTEEDRLLLVFQKWFQPLYGLFDASRDPKILSLIVNSPDESRSLFEGKAGEAAAAFGPYLVRLKPDSRLLKTMLKEGWGKSWGSYFTSTSEFTDIRRHLRHFLEVKLYDGRQVYFRFYDPRVLRLFLPSCTAEEAAWFFGPIELYVLEQEDPHLLLGLHNAGNGVHKQELDLSTVSFDPSRKGSSDKKGQPRPTENRGMLTIRPEQMAVFSQSLLGKFEMTMIAHLHQTFPAQADALGDAQIRELIHFGIAQAKRYGIISERDVSRYIGLMMEWGRNFDCDDSLPWVSAILKHKYVQDPAEKTARLLEKTAELRSSKGPS